MQNRIWYLIEARRDGALFQGLFDENKVEAKLANPGESNLAINLVEGRIRLKDGCCGAITPVTHEQFVAVEMLLASKPEYRQIWFAFRRRAFATEGCKTLADYFALLKPEQRRFAPALEHDLVDRGLDRVFLTMLSGLAGAGAHYRRYAT